MVPLGWKITPKYLGHRWSHSGEKVSLNIYHVLGFSIFFFCKKLQKMWDFMKNRQNSLVWPKLVTFRANYNVLRFSNFQQKGCKKCGILWKTMKKLIDLAETRILWKTIKTVIKTPKSAGHRYSHSRRGQKRPRRNISSKPWSSQLWTQFKQLRIEAWKSQDFNGVRTFQIRSSIYETFHI